MDEHLTDAVEDFRRRIAEQQREVQRLQAIVLELEAQNVHGADERRARASLRSSRADLVRARDDVAELKRLYARFRLREGLGRDPGSLDDDTFDDELRALCRGPLGRRLAHQGVIGFDTCREMLLADLPLGELADNARSARKAGVPDVFDGESATQTILRRWAAIAQCDPYVSEALRRATAALEQYHTSLAEFRRGLDDLRVNYEIKHRGADLLAFHADGDRCVLRAENDWPNIRETFPDEATRLAAHFHALRQAHKELTAVREELNGRLRDYMASFVASYVTYASRQSRERRQHLGLGGQGIRRLAGYLLDEIENIDFLLVGGGGLEVPLPRIPRELAPFSRTDAYREHKGEAEKAEAREDGQPFAAEGE